MGSGEKVTDSRDYRIRATAAHGRLRAVAAVTSRTALEAQKIHQALPTAAAAIGRVMTAAVLLAADLKGDDDRLVVEVDGRGPLGRLVAEVRSGGRVRARVQHADVDLPLRPDGKLAVGQAVGQDGFFTVIQELGGRVPYQGQVALVSGEIGEDLMHYYVQSQQIPSAVALGVLVGTGGTVAAAGGVVVQALPGADDGLVDTVTERFARLKALSHRIEAGDKPEDLIADVLPAPIRWYPREPVHWRCQCSRARSHAILKSLPRADLALLWEDQGAEVTCHFCRAAYRFSADEIRAMLDAGD